MIELTDEEKARFEQWIIENIHEGPDWISADEGYTEALAFNIINAIYGMPDRYDYKPDQDAQIEKWFGEE